LIHALYGIPARRMHAEVRYAPSKFPFSGYWGVALGGVASVPVPVHTNCFDELPRLFGVTALKASARPLTPKRRSDKSDAKEVLI
jgi:hypothetical protein